MAAGTSSVSFLYKDSTVGTPTIKAADHSGVFAFATQVETIT
jgi:hypothetical protein